MLPTSSAWQWTVVFSSSAHSHDPRIARPLNAENPASSSRRGVLIPIRLRGVVPYRRNCTVVTARASLPSPERAITVHRYIPDGTVAPLRFRAFQLVVVTPLAVPPHDSRFTSRPQMFRISTTTSAFADSE